MSKTYHSMYLYSEDKPFGATPETCSGQWQGSSQASLVYEAKDMENAPLSVI